MKSLEMLKICFNESYLRSQFIFPSYKAVKQKVSWVIELYVLEAFHNQKYPFNFNKFFLTYRNKYAFIVKLQILDYFSQKGLLKELNLKNLLQEHRRSTNQLKQIRENILECLNFTKQKKDDLISNNSKIKGLILDLYTSKFNLEMFLKAASIIFSEKNSLVVS